MAISCAGEVLTGQEEPQNLQIHPVALKISQNIVKLLEIHQKMRLKSAIQKSIITAGALIALTFNASAQSFNEPVIRGKYYVCPNGNTFPKYLWGWASTNPMHNRRTWNRTINIDAEIIVGKSPDNYPRREKIRLMKKIMIGIDVPTSYKLQSTELDFHVIYGKTRKNPHVVKHHTYEFANSKGKTLSLSMRNGFDAVVKDNNGKILETDSFFDMNDGISKMECVGDSIVVRQVADFKLKNITNQYGERVRLPLMFLIREVTLKTLPPSSQNEYSF